MKIDEYGPNFTFTGSVVRQMEQENLEKLLSP